MGFDIYVLEPENMKLVEAAISGDSDFYLNCVYKSGTLHLYMSSGSSKAFKDCRFDNGKASCEVSNTEKCVLACPGKPL
ncbi:MAG: hypothetical protein HQK54_13975 [Oligoflexales bacterium]|nr:hypothetical protein [Oligoflexales bacterium]